MAITINRNGVISIEKTVELNKEQINLLIRKAVTQDGYYTGDDLHDRWTALYNAFDLVYGTDIRAEHKKFNRCRATASRVRFLMETDQIDMLLYVASKLYKKDLEEHILEFVK